MYSALIDWTVFDIRFDTFSHTDKDYPRKSTQLIVGLLYLKHVCKLPDEQPVNARYVKYAMILTSNRGIKEWAEVFGDPVIATALLDYKLRHVIVIHIEGASNHLRAHRDLIRPEAPNVSEEATLNNNARSTAQAQKGGLDL